jgi:hypothetical protein
VEWDVHPPTIGRSGALATSKVRDQRRAHAKRHIVLDVLTARYEKVGGEQIPHIVKCKWAGRQKLRVVLLMRSPSVASMGAG